METMHESNRRALWSRFWDAVAAQAIDAARSTALTREFARFEMDRFNRAAFAYRSTLAALE